MKKRTFKYIVIRKIVSIVLSAAMVFMLIPFAALADMGGAEEEPKVITQTLIADSDFSNILNPAAPESFVAEPGANNPYGHPVGQGFLLSEKMEMISLISADVNSGSKVKRSLNWKSGFKSAVTGTAQHQASGTTADAYFGQNQPAKTSSWDASGDYSWGYDLSYVQAQPWDPTGSGRKDHLFVSGVQWEGGKAKLAAYDLNTVDGKSGPLLQIEQLDWLGNDTLRAFEANNFFAAAVGDFDGDEKDTGVVYVPNPSKYGLVMLTASTHTDGTLKLSASGRESILLHEAYRNNAGLHASGKKQDMLFASLNVGDYNGDDYDDLAVLTYTQHLSSKYREDLDRSVYVPYLAISCGSRDNGANITGRKSGGMELVSSGVPEGSYTYYTTMMAPSLSSGAINGSGCSIVIGGLQRKLQAKSGSPNSIIDSRYVPADSMKKMVAATVNVNSSGAPSAGLFTELDANSWTIGGTYRDDDIWSETMVSCVNINGASQAAYTFLNGTLYWINDSGVQKLFEPEYFQSSDNGAGASAVTNSYINTVYSGNFNGNDHGREQVVYTIALKSSGRHDYYFKGGILGGCNFEDSNDGVGSDKAAEEQIAGVTTSEAKAYWSSNIGGDDYLLSFNGDYLEQALCCVLVPADRNKDGVYARFSEHGAGWLYADPTVTALIEPSPYFKELGQAAGGTSFTMTTTYGISDSDSYRFSFGGGVAEEFKATAGAAVKMNVKVGGSTGFSNDYTRSYTKKYSQSFKAAEVETIVLTRIPVLTYTYDLFVETPDTSDPHYKPEDYVPAAGGGYWRLNAMSITVPQQPSAVQLTFEQYNRFVDVYNTMMHYAADAPARMHKINSGDVPVHNFGALAGDPWQYNEEWQTASGNLLPDVLLDSPTTLAYSGGSATSGYSYDESYAHKYSHWGGLSFAFATAGGAGFPGLVEATTGIYFSFDYTYTGGWQVTRGTGTSISGTVTDLNPAKLVPSAAPSNDVIESYGFTWQFGQYSVRKPSGEGAGVDPFSIDGRVTHVNVPYYDTKTDPDSHASMRAVSYRVMDVVRPTVVLGYYVSGVTTPVEAPTELKYTAADTTLSQPAKLSWTGASADAKRAQGASIEGYNIYVIENGAAEKIGTADTTEYDLSAFLTSHTGNSYTFAVTSYATSPASESLFSNKVTGANGGGGGGTNGKSAYELAVENGFRGSLEEWLESLIGADGKSAYDLAVSNGYNGTLDQWLLSLVGKTGAQGKSAYEVAAANGYAGTEAQWLASLEGADGRSAYEIYLENVTAGQASGMTRAEWNTAWNVKQGEAAAAGLTDVNDRADFYYELYQTPAGEDPEDLDEAKWICLLNEEGGYAVYKETVGRYAASESQWRSDLLNYIGGIDAPTAADYYDAYVDSVNAVIPATTSSMYDPFDGGNWLDELMKREGFEVYRQSLSGKILTEEEWIESLNGDDGASAYELALQNGFTGTESEWLASLNGVSAYEIAVSLGYVGTEAEWLESLKGAPGAKGDRGEKGEKGDRGEKGEKGDRGESGSGGSGRDGRDGKDGKDGESAYEIAVRYGFVGSEADWLASLQGAAGAAGTQGTPGAAGAQGAQGIQGAPGAQGIQGAPGADGASAYELAQKHGFKGTEEEWLASLRGDTPLAEEGVVKAVTGMYIDDANELILLTDDAQKINAGSIVSRGGEEAQLAVDANDYTARKAARGGLGLAIISLLWNTIDLAAVVLKRKFV